MSRGSSRRRSRPRAGVADIGAGQGGEKRAPAWCCRARRDPRRRWPAQDEPASAPVTRNIALPTPVAVADARRAQRRLALDCVVNHGRRRAVSSMRSAAPRAGACPRTVRRRLPRLDHVADSVIIGRSCRGAGRRHGRMIDFEIPRRRQGAAGRGGALRRRHGSLPAEHQIGTRPFFDIVQGAAGAGPRPRVCGVPSFPRSGAGWGSVTSPTPSCRSRWAARSRMLGAWALNCMGPQDATMLTLVEHGTERAEGEVPRAARRRRHPDLLLHDRAGRRRRRHRDADPTAVRDGDGWVLERREVVLERRQHCPTRARDGQDRPGGAPPPAVHDVPGRAARRRVTGSSATSPC